MAKNQANYPASLDVLVTDRVAGQVVTSDSYDVIEDAITEIEAELRRVTTKTETGTLTSSEGGLIKVSAAAPYTLYLPTAVGNTGLTYAILKIDANTNLITIDADDTETINGALTYIDLNYQWAYVAMKSDGANWIVLNDSTSKSKIYSAVGSTNISTASTSYVDMANMSITATFPAGKVLIEFCATFFPISSTRLIVIALLIDDDIKTQAMASPYASDPCVVSLKWIETLEAGEHTIKMQWKTLNPTLQQNGATYKRVLTILECR